MASRRPWTVVPHDPIEKLEENLWVVEGDIPGGVGRRRMFMVRRADGGLLFAGAAVPLDEAALAEVTGWGRPAALVVPHHYHMIDAAPFADRLQVGIYGPRACAAGMRKRAPMAGYLEDLPADPHVALEPVSGVWSGEPALIVSSGPRRSLLFGDVIQNTPAASLGFVFRMLGLGGGPKVIPPFRLFFLRDRRALRAQLERWAALPGLCRLVPCHGTIVRQGATEALRAAAATL
jgi:hypothetical protein